MDKPSHSSRPSLYGSVALTGIAGAVLLGCGKWDLALAKAA